jgi:phosphate/sulfate permease
MDKAAIALVVFLLSVVGWILALLISDAIEKNFVEYNTLYEHNITTKQLPTKRYKEYVLKRKYIDDLKSLDKEGK